MKSSSSAQKASGRSSGARCPGDIGPRGRLVVPGCGGVAVARQVRCDGPDAGCGEQREMGPPHGAVGGPGVQQDDRLSLAGLVERKNHGRGAFSAFSDAEERCRAELGGRRRRGAGIAVPPRAHHARRCRTPGRGCAAPIRRHPEPGARASANGLVTPAAVRVRRWLLGRRAEGLRQVSRQRRRGPYADHLSPLVTQSTRIQPLTPSG
jgi:hypothetical protein